MAPSKGRKAQNGTPEPAAAAPASAADDDAEGGQSRDQTYFSYYAQLTNQQNMLQDSVRTGMYHFAIMNNLPDFKDKVVLDVGAGSGILSFFAAQAGAKHVYAVEASGMADMARLLVAHNNMSHKITVLKGKLEETTLPEKVDVIVSEPMGVLLVHERMIETFIKARIAWLKPGGLMFPTTSIVYLAPFTDAFLYSETISKARFWQQTDFYGVDLSGLMAEAVDHNFGQPVVGCFDPRILTAAPVEHAVDFSTISIAQLEAFEIPFSFVSNYTGIVHGIAGWFDVHFRGSVSEVTLSTSPFGQKTHWYQIRFMFKNPLAVNVGQTLHGKMRLKVNDQRSYDVTIEAELAGTALPNGAPVRVVQQFLLHEQQYWYPTLPDPSIPVNPETNNLYEHL